METIRHGHRIPAEPGSGPKAVGISGQGELVALLELDADAMEWQPKKVFFS
jgi:tRNA pseudouridine55 synthase